MTQAGASSPNLVGTEPVHQHQPALPANASGDSRLVRAVDATGTPVAFTLSEQGEVTRYTALSGAWCQENLGLDAQRIALARKPDGTLALFALDQGTLHVIEELTPGAWALPRAVATGLVDFQAANVGDRLFVMGFLPPEEAPGPWRPAFAEWRGAGLGPFRPALANGAPLSLDAKVGGFGVYLGRVGWYTVLTPRLYWKRVTDFEKVFESAQVSASGASAPLGVWRAKLPAGSPFSRLGDLAVGSEGLPAHAWIHVVRAVDDPFAAQDSSIGEGILRHFDDAQLVYENPSPDSHGGCSLWAPRVADARYWPIGHLGSSGRTRPDLSSYRCVRATHAAPADTDQPLWDTNGSRVAAVSRVCAADYTGAPSGTFFARAGARKSLAPSVSSLSVEPNLSSVLLFVNLTGTPSVLKLPLETTPHVVGLAVTSRIAGSEVIALLASGEIARLHDGLSTNWEVMATPNGDRFREISATTDSDGNAELYALRVDSRPHYTRLPPGPLTPNALVPLAAPRRLHL